VSEEPSSLEFFRTGMNKSEAQDDGEVIPNINYYWGVPLMQYSPFYLNTNKIVKTF
jgi:hypothetical protein